MFEKTTKSDVYGKNINEQFLLPVPENMLGVLYTSALKKNWLFTYLVMEWFSQSAKSNTKYFISKVVP